MRIRSISRALKLFKFTTCSTVLAVCVFLRFTNTADEAIALVEDVVTSAPQGEQQCFAIFYTYWLRLLILRPPVPLSGADPDDAVKKTKREEWTVAKLPKYLNRLQYVIEKNNGPYYLGGSLSIADLAVFGLVHGLKSGTYDYVPLDTVDKWPTLVTLYEKVKANPVVAGELPVAV